MGRKKISIQTIDDPKKCKSSFLKRRSGLLKKGYEISVLADIPAAIITFAPDGQLCQFSRGGRLEDILINYLNGPDDPGIPIPNRAEIIAELERIKTENDHTAAEQEARNGGANPRINLADNDDDEDLKRLLAGNHDLLEVMKEIIRILNRHPQTASLSTLEYCGVKLRIILHQIAIRKSQQGNPDHHQQHQQQQYNIPLQLQQQQQYNPLQQQQQYINPTQQQQYQYYHLQQQQRQQQQLVTMANNVISPNYNMQQQFVCPGHKQQQPRTTVHQNNMINVESSGAQGPFLEQLGASASVPVQQIAQSFYQNNSEGGLIRGGSSSSASSRQYENELLPLQQQFRSRQMGFPNGHVGQGLNQNPVQPHTGNSHVDTSSISFQQPNTLQNFFGRLLGAVADNSNNNLDQHNKNQ